MPFLRALLSTPDKARYAEWLRAAMRVEGPEEALTYDPALGALVGPGQRRINLANLHADFLHARRWKRPGLLRRQARAMCSLQPGRPGTSREEAIQRVLPRVRDRLTCEALRIYAPAVQLLWEPFAGDFALSLALDYPDQIREVVQADSERWELDFETLLRFGKERLLAASPASGFQELRPGLFRSAWKDNYDASRLALPGLIRSLPLKGAALAVAPNRDSLLLVGEEDQAGLAELLALAEGILQQEPRPMQGRILRLEGIQWQPYLPPEGSPARPLALRLKDMAIARDYAEQKALLDEAFRKEGRDVFVASHMLRENKEGARHSMATWVAAVSDGLLPWAERLVFVRGENSAEPDEILAVAWEDAYPLVSGLLEPQGLYPERYRHTGFPDEDILVQLRERRIA